MPLYSTVTTLSDFQPETRTLSEHQLRVELAAAYRIFDYLGWTQLIYGHITARVPGRKPQFLINPFGLMYHEITASNLVKVDLDGKIVGNSDYPVNPAGFTIHSAVHAAREDVCCVMHSHTTAGMAVAATTGGLKCHDFAGISLNDRVAYHDFEGVTVDLDERERLSKNLGEKNVMILRNHGLLSCGRTIAEAFRYLYATETACQVQMMAQSSGQTLTLPARKVRERHARALENADNGELAFSALIRLMDRKDPSFRN